MFIHLQEGHTSHSLNESVFNTSGLFGHIFEKQKGIWLGDQRLQEKTLTCHRKFALFTHLITYWQ